MYPAFFPLYGSLRCMENLMTSSNLATIFAPCLLPPPNQAEMSEGRLELRVLILRTFIENPHLFGSRLFASLEWYTEYKAFTTFETPSVFFFSFLGVIPKAVLDSMEFLNNFHPPKDGKHRQKRRHSFKGKREIFKALAKCWLSLAVLLNTINHLQKRFQQKQYPGCGQSQRSTLQFRNRLSRNPIVKTEKLSGGAMVWAHSPMCCCFGPACLLEVTTTLKAVTDFLKKNVNDFFFLCVYRARFYSCHGFTGQPKKQEWVVQNSTGETKKVSCYCCHYFPVALKKCIIT